MATQEKTWNVANRLHSLKDSNNPEVNHIIAGADEIYDDAKGAKQSDINAQTGAALANRYTKAETYSKEQLDSLITTPNVEYVTVATFADLPQTGESDTVYRVSSYDGTQVDITKYALYAWDGTTYQLLAVRSAIGEVVDVSEISSGATYADLSAALADVPDSVKRGGMSIKFILRTNTGTEDEPVYNDEYVQYRYMGTSIATADFTNTANWQGIDEEPTPGSRNLVESGGIATHIEQNTIKEVAGNYINNDVSEIISDKLGTIIGYIKKDGSIEKTIKNNWEKSVDNDLANLNDKAILETVHPIDSETISDYITNQDGIIVAYITKDGKIVKATKNDWERNIENDISILYDSILEKPSATNSEAIIDYIVSKNNVIIAYITKDGKIIKASKDSIEFEVEDIKNQIDVLNGLIDDLSNKDSDSLPSYYDDYIQERVNYINHLLLTTKFPIVSYGFITDIHYPATNGMGGRVLKYILSHTPIEMAICGGDIAGSSAASWGEQENLPALIKTMFAHEKNMSYIRSTGKKLYQVKGNHDYSLATIAYNQGDSWAADWHANRNIVMSSINDSYDVVSNNDDAKGCYYYKDFPTRKLRYFFLDTTDSNGNIPNNNSQLPAITNTQIRWVAEKLLTTPDDYNIVIISHIYFEPNFYPTIRQYRGFEGMYNLFLAVQNKTSYVFDGVTYDFSGFQPSILLNEAGHSHKDNIVYNNGFWTMTHAAEFKTAGAITYSPIYIHFGIDVSKNPYTAEGSIYEVLVDVSLITNEHDLRFVRIGAGCDRILYNDLTEVNAGETATFESRNNTETEAVIKWWCYDSDRCQWVNSKPVYYQTYATIDENTGVLTADENGSGKYVTVVGYDEDNNMLEFFGVYIN